MVLVPTVFIQNGYRVSFYSYDLAERIHVPVFKGGSEAKFCWSQMNCWAFIWKTGGLSVCRWVFTRRSPWQQRGNAAASR